MWTTHDNKASTYCENEDEPTNEGEERGKKEPMKTFAARTFNFTHTFLKANPAQQTLTQHPVGAKKSRLTIKCAKQGRAVRGTKSPA